LEQLIHNKHETKNVSAECLQVFGKQIHLTLIIVIFAFGVVQKKK
jgi:hypothetical protein